MKMACPLNYTGKIGTLFEISIQLPFAPIQWQPYTKCLRLNCILQLDLSNLLMQRWVTAPLNGKVQTDTPHISASNHHSVFWVGILVTVSQGQKWLADVTHVNVGPHTLELENFVCLVKSEKPGHRLVLKLLGALALAHTFTGSCAHMWRVLHKKCCSVALWDM